MTNKKNHIQQLEERYIYTINTIKVLTEKKPNSKNIEELSHLALNLKTQIELEKILEAKEKEGWEQYSLQQRIAIENSKTPQVLLKPNEKTKLKESNPDGLSEFQKMLIKKESN